MDRLNHTDSNDIGILVDNLFRHTAGKLTSTLTRILGPGQIDEAESIVQDAFIKACETWPFKGIPPNPAAWLTAVSKNLAIDHVRKLSRHRSKEADVIDWYESTVTSGEEATNSIDDQLRMMFLTCHPSLPKKSQLALTLKTCAGLSIPEISKALLTKEEAVRKTITRAKEKIRTFRLPFEFPEGEALSDRIESVLQVCYLLFNEGYSATSGESLVRYDLVDESIRLASLFIEGPLKENPEAAKVKALLALMLLQSSRLNARHDGRGAAVLLQDQDRDRWDKKRIALGLEMLNRSAGADELTRYHLEARIAAAHAVVERYEDADWRLIRMSYDRLFEMTGNPVVALNRAMAVSMESGAAAGISELEVLRSQKALVNYHLLYAAFGDLYRKTGAFEAAIRNYRKAVDFCDNKMEIDFLNLQIEELKSVGSD